MKPTKIFISYSHDEINREKPRLLYFVQELRKELGTIRDFKIIVDYEHVKSGGDVNSFMETQAKQCDIAIILLSPEYNDKVIKKDKGVYKEFKILYDRFLDYVEKGTYDGEFLILPIIFVGKFDDVKLTEISHLITRDFSRMYVFQNDDGDIRVAESIKKEYKPYFEEFAQRIKAVRDFKSREFGYLQANFFKFFFKDTKSAWGAPHNQKYIDDVFVKTSVYQRVRQESVRFIVGRKGSGKSTIADVLPILESHRLSFKIPIIADNIYLETCYNLFSSSRSLDSDTKNIFRRNDTLAYIWDVFFHCCFVYDFVINNVPFWDDPKINLLKEYIFELLEWDEKEWTRDETPNPKDYTALFLFSFQNMSDFINNIIASGFGKPSKIGAVFAIQFRIDKYREYVFSKDILNSVYYSISLIKKKILLSFDGFDTAFEQFRIQSINDNVSDQLERASFEKDWLLSMILLIHNNGFPETPKNELYAKFHYCITIPFDRYIEMKKLDRDAYRHRNDFVPLRWSGLELSALLRKRLVEYKKSIDEPIEDDRKLLIEDRLTKVLSQFREIPLDVEIEVNKQKYVIPLFIYILRHSFWRPRDILYYYANILAATQLKATRKREKSLDNDYIRQIVRTTTRQVIRDEFLNEFRTLCGNFEDVIDIFFKSKQIISWQEVSELLTKVDFAMVAGDIDEFTINEKIEFLYKIGFLGVIVPDDLRKRDNKYKYAFMFNEDSYLIDVITKKRYQECSFVIHPIFCEFLQLNIEGNPELILNFDWEYLINNEKNRDLSPTIQ